MSNRPPEGRRERHNKPMIPVSNNKKDAPQLKAGEGFIAGPVEGMVIARKLLFRAATSQKQWHVDMLIAIAAAKAMGASQFEIAIDGVPQRPKQNNGSFWITLGGDPVEGEEWRKSATETGECVVSIYALVLEDAR